AAESAAERGARVKRMPAPNAATNAIRAPTPRERRPDGKRKPHADHRVRHPPPRTGEERLEELESVVDRHAPGAGVAGGSDTGGWKRGGASTKTSTCCPA
ncbi:MAG: hypothetical protein ACK55I_26140, partial [bacterium]